MNSQRLMFTQKMYILMRPNVQTKQSSSIVIL